jgi:hypothetical protein
MKQPGTCIAHLVGKSLVGIIYIHAHTPILRTTGKADIGQQYCLIMGVWVGLITGFNAHIQQIELPMLPDWSMARFVQQMNDFLTGEFGLLGETAVPACAYGQQPCQAEALQEQSVA